MYALCAECFFRSFRNIVTACRLAAVSDSSYSYHFYALGWRSMVNERRFSSFPRRWNHFIAHFVLRIHEWRDLIIVRHSSGIANRFYWNSRCQWPPIFLWPKRICIADRTRLRNAVESMCQWYFRFDWTTHTNASSVTRRESPAIDITSLSSCLFKVDGTWNFLCANILWIFS